MIKIPCQPLAMMGMVNQESESCCFLVKSTRLSKKKHQKKPEDSYAEVPNILRTYFWGTYGTVTVSEVGFYISWEPKEIMDVLFFWDFSPPEWTSRLLFPVPQGQWARHGHAQNLSTHTTWDTKNWLLKSKSPSFPLPDTGKTRTSSAKALPWGKHPPLDKGQTRTRRVPMQLRSQTSGEKRDAAMEMNVRDRRWPGWTVDESCSFPTKAGDPTFLPTNDTLALFFLERTKPLPNFTESQPKQRKIPGRVVSKLFWRDLLAENLQTNLWLAQIYTASQPNLHKWPVFWSTKGQARFVRAANLQNSVELQNQRAL